jgi:hypothetical protein
LTRAIAAAALLASMIAACSAAGSPAPPATPGRAAPHTNADPRCHARGTGLFVLPDRRCTPGATDRRVTQANIGSTICRSGYTRTVRPPESVTEPEKLRSMAAYGDHRPPHYYEYDHLIPLELGGAPNNLRNLWPEPGGVPNPKDRLEYRLRTLVCDGSMRLARAQHMIATDWVSAYRRLIG